MRYLVTGGAGFIGSHIVERLVQQGADVTVLDDLSTGKREHLRAVRDRIRFIRSSVARSEACRRAMQGVDCVFHLAALWLLHCHDYPRSAFEVNIGGTFNVLEACVAAGVKRLVYSSSASVYGDAVVTPMTEDHPFNNRTFYGATKIAGEQMCRAFHHRYGLSYVGLRYMNVYGARQDERGAYTSVIMKVLERIADGLPPIVFGDGSQTYDFIYVDDAVAVLRWLLDSATVNGIFNVGTGKAESFRDMIGAMFKAMGRQPNIEYIDMPEAIRGQYQYFTQSSIENLRKAGYNAGFTPLEKAVGQFVSGYLDREDRYR